MGFLGDFFTGGVSSLTGLVSPGSEEPGFSGDFLSLAEVVCGDSFLAVCWLGSEQPMVMKAIRPMNKKANFSWIIGEFSLGFKKLD